MPHEATQVLREYINYFRIPYKFQIFNMAHVTALLV